MALRAEVYTDNVAKKLAMKYKMKYLRGYGFNKRSRDFLKSYFNY